MIQVSAVRQIVEECLQNTDYEIASINVSKDNDIVVEIDSLHGADVGFCANLNNRILERLGAEEDYSLEVGSVSLSAPFTRRMQYNKHLGDNIVVTMPDGSKVKGVLVSVDELTFSLDVERLVQAEGKKRKQKQLETVILPYDGVKEVKYDFKV